MIFSENLDHKPESVTLERLPNGTAWLYLRKDAHKVPGEVTSADGQRASSSWECTTAMCKIGPDYAAETQESISSAFDEWWIYAEGWTTESEMLPTLEERVTVLETLFMGGMF